MEFEEILEEVGSYGSYQKNLLFLFCAPLYFLGSFLTMALIFVVSVPDHWCHVPEAFNMSAVERRALVGAPQDTECHMRDLNYSGLLSTMFTPIFNETDIIECQNGWEYDKSHFELTAASQWNMVCSESHYPSLVLTLQNVGGLIGTPISGALADRFGRKSILFAAVLLMCVTELFSILTPSFYLFALARTINGLAMTSLFVLPFILVTEQVAPEKRVNVNGIVNCSWMLGMCTLPLIVYLTRSWIILGLFNAVAAACLLCYWKYVIESPVWLITRERYDEALHFMKQIAKRNGKEADEILLTKMIKTLGERIRKKKVEEDKNSCSSILQFPSLRNIFFILTFCWIADFTSYMGLQYNVINLEGNIFLNFFLLSVVECPGNVLFWFLMERIGRRWSATIGFFSAGIVILMHTTGLPYSEIVSCVVGKLIISGTFMVTDQQACELFPTASRTFFMGISKFISKAITMLSPYLIYLRRYGKAIPFVSMSLLCFMSGISAAFLPESLDQNLPQNVSDLENFQKDQKFFSFNRFTIISYSSHITAFAKEIKLEFFFRINRFNFSPFRKKLAAGEADPVEA